MSPSALDLRSGFLAFFLGGTRVAIETSSQRRNINVIEGWPKVEGRGFEMRDPASLRREGASTVENGSIQDEGRAKTAAHGGADHAPLRRRTFRNLNDCKCRQLPLKEHHHALVRHFLPLHLQRGAP